MPKHEFDAIDQPEQTSKDQKTRKRKTANFSDETNTTTTTTTTTPTTTDNNTPPNFTAIDFAYLNENEHGRYAPNSKKIGHAVIMEQNEKMMAFQYKLPFTHSPEVRPLINIEAIEPFPGMHRFRAQTPDGKTPMFAKRVLEGKVGDKEGSTPIQIACFSPSPETNKQPFWGSIKPTPIFRTDLSKAVKKDLKKDLKDIKSETKGGDELVVEHASVPQRDAKKTRNPVQNKVMGESAREAYENFCEKLADELNPEMKKRLKRAYEADIKDSFKINSFRPEWLHAKGWSLMPMSIDPQTKDNLAAGPKWANTQMMLLERIIKWFALNDPKSVLTIKPKFDMLLDSDLIEHIDFQVKIQIKGRYVELMQHIDVFLQYPQFPKASDLAQGAGITHSILYNIDPVSQQEVIKKPIPRRLGKNLEQNSSDTTSQTSRILKPLNEVNRLLKNSNNNSTAFQPLTTAGQKKQLDENATNSPKSEPPATQTAEQTTPSQPVTNSRKRKRGDSQDEGVHSKSTKAKSTEKKRFPTQQHHARSVVQIYASSFFPDYDNPWRDPESQSSSGSGLVIENLGKKYILTNAHVAENPVFLQVRLANDRLKKYEAKVKCVSYQCDLALLEVDDPEFNELAQPVELGEMVRSHQGVTVVGFPMGGTEISVSKGIVSRIEVDTYSMSGQSLLQVQVDAAINPGNSGGPIFSENKVVGVAFQGYSGHQGLGYIIPIPIIKHFLTEAFSDKEYRGFPIIPFQHEELVNKNERAFYQMDKRTGIRVVKVDNLSDAYEKLKRDDILLSIDGLPISNEGTVDIPGIGNCIDFIHVTQSKFIGDKVTLRILRKNSLNGNTEEIEVDVLLDTIYGDTEKVSVAEHDKMPTFYINSGICFVPLTRNYLEGGGSDFEEMISIEEHCSFVDTPKKNSDEQIIVINQIIKCKETEGYGKHHNAIVKLINGKSINTIRDVLKAMEGNKDPIHVITLSSNSKIVVPNMPLEDLKLILKRNHISHHCSSDLLATEANEDELKLTTELKQQSVNFVNKESSKLHQSNVIELTQKAPESKQLKLKKNRVVISDVEDELSTNENESCLLTKNDLPGLKRYKKTLDEMEEFYKQFPENDEEDEEGYATLSDEEDDEDYSDSEDIESSSEEQDSDPQPPQKNRPLNTLFPKYNFFKPSPKQESGLTEKIKPQIFK